MTAPYDAEREARELRRRAEHVVDVARRADPDDAILYVLGTLASAHAAGLAQGRAQMREQAAQRVEAMVPDPSDSRFATVRKATDWIAAWVTAVAVAVRALPTDTTAREAEESEK